MRVGPKGVLVTFVALTSAAFARDAGAGDVGSQADQKAAAQALFERGRQLLEQGHSSEACPKFAESLRLDPGIGTMLWLADCYESNDRIASAWAVFKEAAAAADLVKDARANVARERAANLEPKLSYLTILVPPDAVAQSVQVRRDGVPVESAQYGLPVPLDPGVHAIKAEAPNRKPWTTTVELKGATLPVTIPVLEEQEPPAPPPASFASPEAAFVPNPPAPRAGIGAQRVVALAVGGAGVAGVVIGSIFGLDAKSTYDQSNTDNHCVNNVCDVTGKKDRSDANSMATVADVAIGAGAVALVGAAVLFFTGAPSGPARAGVAVVPARGGGSVQVRASW